jgi:hypothetical protein
MRQLLKDAGCLLAPKDLQEGLAEKDGRGAHIVDPAYGCPA